MLRALDIMNEIEDRLSYEQTDTIDGAELTSDQRKILRLMNRVLNAWQNLDDWPLLRKDEQLVLVAQVISDNDSDGSDQFVTATQDSTTMTIVNGAFSDIFIGRAIQISGDDYVYRIASVSSTTEIELNRAWISATIAAGTWNAGTEEWDDSDEKTFCVGSDRYALPIDFDRPTGQMQAFFAPYGVKAIGPDSLLARRRRDKGLVTGEVETFTIYGTNDAGTVQLIHFHPWPKDARMLLFTYQQDHPKLDSDNDQIRIETRYSEVYIEAVVNCALRDFEDDDAIQQNIADMLSGLNQALSQGEMTRDKKVIRLANRRRKAMRSGARMGGHRIDWGDHFDVAGNTGYFE